jgi:alpha-amylase
VYDQGWGMADPEHAMVFIDNHDNQRGHGGGGSSLLIKSMPNFFLASDARKQ